jgi:hypothetical protein
MSSKHELILIIIAVFKVYGSDMSTLLCQTPIFEWDLARLAVKYKTPKIHVAM